MPLEYCVITPQTSLMSQTRIGIPKEGLNKIYFKQVYENQDKLFY